MRVRDDYRSLRPGKSRYPYSFPERGAVLEAFGMMDDEEILELSQIISTLGRISPGVIERLFIDFAEQMSSTNAVVGSHDSTERLLLKSGMNQDKIDSIMEEIRGPAGRTMWENWATSTRKCWPIFYRKNIRKPSRSYFQNFHRPCRPCSGAVSRQFCYRGHPADAADGDGAEGNSR